MVAGGSWPSKVTFCSETSPRDFSAVLWPTVPLPAMRPQDPYPLASVSAQTTSGWSLRGLGSPDCGCRTLLFGRRAWVCGCWAFCCLSPAWKGFVVCCCLFLTVPLEYPQHRSAPSLPGPAGPGPVADADPAVPVRQLPAAPAGEQLCVHPDAAGRPLGDKDTVSFWRARVPVCPALLSLGCVSGVFCPLASKQVLHPSRRETCALLVVWVCRFSSRGGGGAVWG